MLMQVDEKQSGTHENPYDLAANKQGNDFESYRPGDESDQVIIHESTEEVLQRKNHRFADSALEQAQFYMERQDSHCSAIKCLDCQ